MYSDEHYVQVKEFSDPVTLFPPPLKAAQLVSCLQLSVVGLRKESSLLIRFCGIGVLRRDTLSASRIPPESSFSIPSPAPRAKKSQYVQLRIDFNRSMPATFFPGETR
jgi:hypothetical protein